MRRLLVHAMILATFAATAAPAAAHPNRLDGPNPAIWRSDPGGVDGVSGIEQGDPVEGSTGWAKVRHDGAKIKVRVTGLEPNHAYTMWVAYFNDQRLCVDGCNGADRAAAGGGVIWGDGRIGNHNGTATFIARLNNGAGADYVGENSPPPFALAPFEAGEHNEFHIVIRSHGPLIPGEVYEQLTTFGGGCEIDVGPAPGEQGDFPVPLELGECGDVQLYVFS